MYQCAFTTLLGVFPLFTFIFRKYYPSYYFLLETDQLTQLYNDVEAISFLGCDKDGVFAAGSGMKLVSFSQKAFEEY